MGKEVKEAAQANKTTSTYAASNASPRQEDQNMAAGSGSRTVTRSRANLQPPPGYGQGYHHTAWIATTHNQGQGAQQYGRQRYSAGPVTQDIIEERYENSLQWMEQILDMTREQPGFYEFLGHSLKRVWGMFRGAQRMRFENR